MMIDDSDSDYDGKSNLYRDDNYDNDDIDGD